MYSINNYVALFDLDGVVMNTEPQYTQFWDAQGMHYLGIPHFCSLIKGQTLTQIFDVYFPDDDAQRKIIQNDLNDFERQMSFNYIDGADTFIAALRQAGVRTALVTSSNEDKMANVYHAHAEFKGLFDKIFTAEMFEHSKPNPECFLTAMKGLQATAEQSVVFEDSFHGLEAGRKAGAYVVGLATTNPRSAVEGQCDWTIDNFVGVTPDTLYHHIIESKKSTL
jgi:beta-phosphoglucomutase